MLKWREVLDIVAHRETIEDEPVYRPIYINVRLWGEDDFRHYPNVSYTSGMEILHPNEFLQMVNYSRGVSFHSEGRVYWFGDVAEIEIGWME
jgi:hypothetical protein